MLSSGKARRRVYSSKGVKKIGYQSFYDCKNLKKLILPDGVEGIAGEAFNGASLKEIVIPDSVTRISRFGDVFDRFDPMTVYGYKYSYAIKIAKEEKRFYK